MPMADRQTRKSAVYMLSAKGLSPSPTAPTKRASATCQTLSPVFVEVLPMMTCTRSAAVIGMAMAPPRNPVDQPESPLSTVGIQKLKPQKPMTHMK